MCCTTASSIRSDLSPEARTVLVRYDVDLLKLMEVLSLLLTTGFFLRKDSLKYWENSKKQEDDGIVHIIILVFRAIP